MLALPLYGGLLVRLTPRPAETDPGDIDQRAYPVRVVECISQPKRCSSGMAAHHHAVQAELAPDRVEIGDRAFDRIGTSALRAPRSSLIPADHPQLSGQQRHQRGGHVPQPGAAVAHHDRRTAPFVSYPEPAAIIGLDHHASMTAVEG